MRITQERADELRRKAEAATKGPWTTEKPERDADGWPLGQVVAGTPGRQGVYAHPEGGTSPWADCLHIAAANPATVLDLLADRDELMAEVERLRRRCDMRDRSAARWSAAAASEAPETEAIKEAREDFVECKIRQEEAPPGSIMRRVCDAAMRLIDLLDERDTKLKARVVALALEVAKLRAKCEERKAVLVKYERALVCLADGMFGTRCACCDDSSGELHEPDCAWKRAMEDA